MLFKTEILNIFPVASHYDNAFVLVKLQCLFERLKTCRAGNNCVTVKLFRTITTAINLSSQSPAHQINVCND